MLLPGERGSASLAGSGVAPPVGLLFLEIESAKLGEEREGLVGSIIGVGPRERMVRPVLVLELHVAKNPSTQIDPVSVVLGAGQDDFRGRKISRVEIDPAPRQPLAEETELPLDRSGAMLDFRQRVLGDQLLNGHEAPVEVGSHFRMVIVGKQESKSGAFEGERTEGRMQGVLGVREQAFRRKDGDKKFPLSRHRDVCHSFSSFEFAHTISQEGPSGKFCCLDRALHVCYSYRT